MLVVLAYLLLHHRSLCHASVPSSGQPNNKNVDFLINRDMKTADVLQQDLRKNNDDYKDILSKNTLEGNNMIIHSSKNKTRRAFNSGGLNSIKEAKFHETYVKPNVLRKLETTFTVDDNKVNQMINYLEKRKQSQDFPKNQNNMNTEGSDSEEADTERRLRASEEPRADNMPDMRLPTGLQLDMALAIGGRVQTMRNRNRLCFRHVLIPEGPKYDSRGKVYLAEFRTVRGRQYHQTRAPKLLLPKCCNCCAKSVLGCE